MLLLLVSADEFETERNKLRQMGVKALMECKTKIGASEEDFQAAIKKELPTSKKGFCMLECVFNKANIMKDGKLSVDGALKTMEPALSKNADMNRKARRILQACNKEVGKGANDQCDTAKMVAECFKREASK